MAEPELSQPFKEALTRLHRALYAGVNAGSVDPIDIEVSGNPSRPEKWVKVDTSPSFARTYKNIVEDVFDERKVLGNIQKISSPAGISIEHILHDDHAAALVTRLNDLATVIEGNQSLAKDYVFVTAALAKMGRVDKVAPHVELRLKRELLGDNSVALSVVVEHFSPENWEKVRGQLQGIAAYERRRLDLEQDLRVDMSDVSNLRRLEQALQSVQEKAK